MPIPNSSSGGKKRMQNKISENSKWENLVSDLKILIEFPIHSSVNSVRKSPSTNGLLSMNTPSKNNPMNEIDSYIADLENPLEREALENLRKILRELLPGAVECISYGIPTLKVGGK